MLNLSNASLLEANSLFTDGVWLILLEINLPSMEEPIRIVRNTDNITWNGHVWQAFPFQIGDVTEASQGEMPTLDIKVSNISQVLQPLVEKANGGNGSVVILRVVNSKHLDANVAEIEEDFVIQQTTCTFDWITFSLGGDYILNSRFPPRRILKDRCYFTYKGIECGSTSSYTTCPKTLDGCIARNNYARFGGEASIPQGGLYVSN